MKELPLRSILVLLVATATLSLVGAQSNSLSNFTQNANQRVDGAAIGSPLAVNSSLNCADKCLNTKNCVSFTYQKAQKLCTFNEYSSTYTVSPDPANDYYLKILLVNNAPVKPKVQYQLQVPLEGISLPYGILRAVMEANLDYLSLFPLDDLLYFYRLRAGQPSPPGECWGWDANLRGSISGLFMMGTGNSLRWMKNSTLQAKLNDLVAGISQTVTEDGYIMAYPKNYTKVSENPNYVLSWVTHGLWDTYLQGNTEALTLARKQLNWYNTNPYLPEYLPPNTDPNRKPGTYGDYEGHGIYIEYQGMIHNSILALSPVGNQGDVDVLINLYQEDGWLRGLIARNTSAVWQRVWFSHNYELTAVEAYLDLYIITGNGTYLDAVFGAWDLFYAHWIHVGGSIAINEGPPYPPNSYYLAGMTTPGAAASQSAPACTGPSLGNPSHAHGHHHEHMKSVLADTPQPTGETCGTVFWTRLNQRLHRLFPTNETYVTEIERSIYNVGVANQNPYDGGNRYFTYLHRYKDHSSIVGTCCEGQGTRFRGTFPEYIYSVSKSGIVIDLFVPSTYTFTVNNVDVDVQMDTLFPYDNKVNIAVKTSAAVNFTIDIRIPSWASASYPLSINGKPFATGKAGTYVRVDQAWSATNTITFQIPMTFRASKYTGNTQIGSYTRYAYEYGPILMAALGPWNSKLDCLLIPGTAPANPNQWMTPINGKPLHYYVQSNNSYSFVPYFEVQFELFTSYPIML